jgi:2-C-methyl-D-erythritol 4-phosphate cytidylyltransferase
MMVGAFSMKRSMIIVAGGSGTRMGAEIPKQFMEVAGKPILMHTLEVLHNADKTMQLILVLPSDQFHFWEALKNKHQFKLQHEMAVGGATRFLSVSSGLERVTGELVGVHDGVRPFVSEKMVETCFSKAEETGAAVPVVPIVQSLRRLEEDRSEAVDRNLFRAVQTPQCFKTHILKAAFKSASGTDYSDDATVVEANGQTVALVDGDLMNIKITSPLDIELAELITARRTISN